MRVDKGLEKSMAMSDATWARHANPLSVYTRIPVLPLLALAIWSRIWIGWWCLVPIALLVAWTIYNPRAFPEPDSLDHWASKGVMGERLWLARKEQPIPKHHQQWAFWLGVVGAVCVVPMAWGLYALEPWAASLGTLLVVALKIWFVDRMAWLYDEQNSAS